ncbi:MAG: ABC transporter ATP-binding protein [candidate division WOR-3 bacterium]
MKGIKLIELTNIDFGYPGQKPIFTGLNFSLIEGERIGIIGPNGCGKTTLFNIIVGFLKPANGIIKIFGKVRNNEKDFQEVRQRIGYLFQNSDDQLFCPSVREEIAFGPLNLRWPKDRIKQTVKEMLELVGLEGFEDRSPYNLSEGEKRRLALATVMATKPQVLLLDEPTNGLDEMAVEKIVEILSGHKFSTIVISQDINFLKKTTDFIYRFSDRQLKRI